MKGKICHGITAALTNQKTILTGETSIGHLNNITITHHDKPDNNTICHASRLVLLYRIISASTFHYKCGNICS